MKYATNVNGYKAPALTNCTSEPTACWTPPPCWASLTGIGHPYPLGHSLTRPAQGVGYPLRTISEPP